MNQQVLATECQWVEFNDLSIMYWNTGRMYTKEGQKIIAVEDGNGVMFFDISRNISGCMSDCGLDANEIMQKYDMNDYWGICTEDQYCIQRSLLFGDSKVESIF